MSARVPRGFTLLEAIVSLAIVALLLAGMVAFQWGLTDTRARMLAGVRRSQAVDGLIERLESDLVSAIAGDAARGPGLKGDATSIRVISRGVWLTGPEEARRWLPGEGAAGAELPKATPSDLVASAYGSAGGEGGTGGGAVTVRRWLVEPGAASSLEGSAAVRVEIAAIRLKYFDGSAWLDRFDSLEAGGLPAAVEVSVWGTRAAPAVDDGRPSEEPVPDRVRVIAIPEGGVTGGRAGAEP